MNVLFRLHDKKPFIFVLMLLLAWLILGAMIVVAVAKLLHLPITDNLPQIAGTLGATIILLLFVSRLGWLRPLGITTFGTWQTWLLTLLLGLYLVLTSFYAFFGEINFDVGSLFDTPAARTILYRDAIVGFVEETMFRGIILYALVRIWGKTKRGLVSAVFVQAGLFGCLHALQGLAGGPPTIVLLTVMYSLVSGIWLGLLVIRVTTIWPAILLHAVSNIAILIKGLSSSWVDPVSLGYVWATLFELPLVLIGLWIIIKIRPLDSRSTANFKMPDDGS